MRQIFKRQAGGKSGTSESPVSLKRFVGETFVLWLIERNVCHRSKGAESFFLSIVKVCIYFIFFFLEIHIKGLSADSEEWSFQCTPPVVFVRIFPIIKALPFLGFSSRVNRSRENVTTF